MTLTDEQYTAWQQAKRRLYDAATDYQRAVDHLIQATELGGQPTITHRQKVRGAQTVYRTARLDEIRARYGGPTG